MIDEQSLNQTIGIRVKALRLSRGIPQEKIAKAIGSKTNRVTRIENGRSSMSAAELIAMAKALGVTTSQLVGEEPVAGGAS